MDVFIPARTLIIHGGMNSNLITDGKFKYFNDIHAFDLVQLDWIKVEAYSYD